MKVMSQCKKLYDTIRGWSIVILIAFLFWFWWVFVRLRHGESALKQQQCLVVAHACHTSTRLHLERRSFHCNNPSSFSSAHLFSVPVSRNGVWVSPLFTLLLFYGFAFMFFLCCWFHVLVELHLTVWERRASLTPDGCFWVRRFIPRP